MAKQTKLKTLLEGIFDDKPQASYLFKFFTLPKKETQGG